MCIRDSFEADRHELPDGNVRWIVPMADVDSAMWASINQKIDRAVALSGTGAAESRQILPKLKSRLTVQTPAVIKLPLTF